MSSTPFVTVSTQFSIYAGLSIFTFGIVGNLINLCLLFSTRTISCSLLLFVSSFFNITALSVGLLPRVLSIGFGIDASSTSMLWCKSRLFISYIGTLMSLTCICFPSIDRFFITCRNVTWRNRSKLSTTKIAILIALFVVIAIDIPYLVLYTITEVKSSTGNITTKCSSSSSSFVLYQTYFVRPILIGILPGTILCVTGLLTYRNIKSISGIQRRGIFQRSLTSMLLLQIVAIVIPIAPFATMNIYQTLTSSLVKTAYQLAQESLVLDITNIILYISYASNFYVYLISASSSYRQDFVKFVLFCYRRTNRIEPMAREQLAINTASIVKQLPRSVLPNIT